LLARHIEKLGLHLAQGGETSPFANRIKLPPNLMWFGLHDDSSTLSLI